jgi:hypothetical protein
MSMVWKGKPLSGMARTDLLQAIDEIHRWHTARYVLLGRTIADATADLKPMVQLHGGADQKIALLKLDVQARCIAATPINDGTECGRRQGDAT